MTLPDPVSSDMPQPGLRGTGSAAKPEAAWRNLDLGGLLLGVGLAVFLFPILMHFFGVLWALAWLIPVCLMQVAVQRTSNRVKGETGMLRPAIVANAAFLAIWAFAAMALWTTGNRSAWVCAMAMMTTLAFHVVFSGQRNFKLNIFMLAIPVLPLLYIMVAAAWAEYSWWVAILATLSSFGTIASIGTAAKLASKNYSRMQTAFAQVNAAQQRLSFAIESAGEGYFEIDFADMIYRPNPKLALSLGFEPGGKDLMTLQDRVHPDDAEEAFGKLAQCTSGELQGWNQDLRVRVATGGFRWMHLRARVLEDGGGRALIGTLVDLSERKALERDLRAAKEAAEGSSRSKSEFLANMSHEIRTPLNGVLGMAQSLAADDLPPEQKEKIAVILDSGNSLMALLNDVLDVSKIEAGKLEIAPVPGDFLHTMERTRQLFEARAEEKGLELTINYDPSLPRYLSYDPIRVRQCVSNLLSNAIKFTERGSVEATVSAQPDQNGSYIVSISIADSGIGISDDVLSRLFSAFTQADGATTRRFGGSGLGLAISRQLARLMDGDITVTSREGLGSTFLLTFRAREVSQVPLPARSVAAEQGAKHSIRGVRVLLTDDNTINRQVIRLFLAPHGCELAEAANGKEALDLLAAKPFDLVLLDVHMPVMDGRQTIAAIRASRHPWRSIPVIALTADAMSGDRERYLALGMDDYISKPVDQRELVAKIHQVLHIEAEAAAKTGTTG